MLAMVIDTVENSWGVNWIPRYFTRNIQSFGLSSICVVCNIDEIWMRALKIATKWKTTYLLGCWLRILSGDGFHLWLLGELDYLNFFGIDTVENSWVVNLIPRYFTRNIKSFGLSSICVVCNIIETSPFGDSISVHCGVFHIFWIIPDQLFWKGVP